MEKQEETATVKIKVKQGARKFLQEQPEILEDTLLLRKEEQEWKIVPSAFPTTKDEYEALNRRPFASLVVAMQFPQVLMRARSKARAASCITNVKQISLALLMSIQDHYQHFPSNAATYKTILMKYINSAKYPDRKLFPRKEQIFHCPLDQSGKDSYSLNANLEGLPQTTIEKPEITVMVYEGQNQKLLFRHDGKAVVGFADGHARLIDIKEAKTLRWIAYSGWKPLPGSSTKKPKK